MDTVTEIEMVKAMAGQGAIGILHRFYKDPAKFLADAKEFIRLFDTVAFSVGVSQEHLSVVEAVLNLGPRTAPIVCVDIAHGHLKKCAIMVSAIRRTFGDKVQIIAGNVCTPMGVSDLVIAGADAIKIGVGGGSLCSTRIVTGHGCSNLTTIMQARQTISGMKSNVTLIADGGITSSGDIIKALAAGADSVMIGGLLAGTDESPGEVETGPNGEAFKVYRGQSSREFLDDLGRDDVAPEGVQIEVPYKGSVSKILKDLIGGIRSGLTYSGAKNLQELYDKAIFTENTYHGYIESTPHGLKNG
jgi:IMP dehydrogenase